jgi:hypothetical protein
MHRLAYSPSFDHPDSSVANCRRTTGTETGLDTQISRAPGCQRFVLPLVQCVDMGLYAEQTQWNRVVLENLVVAQHANKFPAFCGARKLITC